MLIDFSKLTETEQKNFKGGEGSYIRRFTGDEACTIMRGCLRPGSSIGEHTHEDSCEIIYVLSGTASIVCDGVSETVEAGQAHYCPKGSTHVMKNNGDRDLVAFAAVPKQ